MANSQTTANILMQLSNELMKWVPAPDSPHPPSINSRMGQGIALMQQILSQIYLGVVTDSDVMSISDGIKARYGVMGPAAVSKPSPLHAESHNLARPDDS